MERDTVEKHVSNQGEVHQNIPLMDALLPWDALYLGPYYFTVGQVPGDPFSPYLSIQVPNINGWFKSYLPIPIPFREKTFTFFDTCTVFHMYISHK